MSEITRLSIGQTELRRWLKDESGLIQGPQPPVMKALIEQAVDEGLSLAAPAYLYRVYEVQKVRHSSLLVDGTAVGNEWFASMMAPAQLIVLAVCTIGPRLEARTRAYTAAGDGAAAYFLDRVGTGLVELTRCTLLAELDQKAAQLGLQSSIPLSPGDTQWPLDQQRIIFEMLPAQMLDVSLTPGMVMKPLKSVSLAVGMGLDMGRAAEGSACDYCDIRDRCQLRLARTRLDK